MEPVAFEVVGIPVPQGSLRPMVSRSTGKPFLAQDQNLLRYRADLRAIALEVMARDERALMPWAVALHVTFTLPRPAYHFLPVNTKRTEPEVKPDAPVFPFGPPDLDKLCRAVLDALTGIVYLDDAQVIRLNGRKIFSDEPTFGGLTTITVFGGDAA